MVVNRGDTMGIWRDYSGWGWSGWTGFTICWTLITTATARRRKVYHQWLSPFYAGSSACIMLYNIYTTIYNIYKPYISLYHPTGWFYHGGHYPIFYRDLMYFQISLVSMRSMQLAVEATKCLGAAGASCVCCGKWWHETMADLLHDTRTHLAWVWLKQ